nr:dihydropyrimidinase [Halomonas socia]
MAFFDTVIRNGTVVTASDTMVCDVGIKNGRIVALGEHIEEGSTEIDATDLLVLPGGIDSHVHLEQPTSDGSVMADDFESGTRSAACGGNTMVIPFSLQERGESLLNSVQEHHDRASGKCHIDYALHAIITDPSEQALVKDLPEIVKGGITSVKIFMTYENMALNDAEIFRVMEATRHVGALTMVHAENFDAIRQMTERLERAGHTGPRGHADSRPIVVEREATHRAISFAELVDVPLFVVHVSGGDVIEQIEWAKRRGLPIYAETCPQYLTLTADDLDSMPTEGAKYVCSPPPRDVANQEACWDALARGVFSTFTSDHCPFVYASDTGKQIKGAQESFKYVPNGIPGVETRLPILFSKGVSEGRITLNDFVALTATNHAKIYGMYPQKGSIAIGSDADIAIWDPKKRVTLTQDILNHNCDYTPYEGMTLTGYPVVVMVRGRVVAKDGKPAGEPGYGEFVSRGRSSLVPDR